MSRRIASLTRRLDIPDELCSAQQGSDHGVEITPKQRIGCSMLDEFWMVVGDFHQVAATDSASFGHHGRCQLVSQRQSLVGHKQRVRTNGLGVETLGDSTGNSPFHSPHRVLQSESAPKNIS